MRLKLLPPGGAPLSSRFVLGVAAGRSVALAGMFQMSQCVHVPMGASGSSTIRARDCVPAGASSQLSAGERSAPSQVYFFGITPPFGNAVDFRVKDIARPPCGSPCAGSTETRAPVWPEEPDRAQPDGMSSTALVRISNAHRRLDMA